MEHTKRSEPGEPMRFIRSIHVLCLVAGALLSACAEKPLQADGYEVETELNNAGTWDSQCHVGINMRQDGTILYMANWVQDVGLRRGDRITTVDSKPFQDGLIFFSELKRRKPGDVLQIAVDRGGESERFPLECRDSGNVKAAYRKVVEAMKDNDSGGCLQALSNLDGETALTSFRLGIAFSCQYEKKQKRATAAQLDDGFTKWRIKLEEVTSDSAALEAVTPRILQIVQWMQQNRNPKLAEALEDRLNLAQNLTFNGSTTASNENGKQAKASGQPQDAHPGDSSGFISSGTGFAVTADGTVVTCAHVIKNANSISVTTADGIQHKASVLAVNYNTDLAVLRAETTTPVYLALGATEEARLGDKLFTIGFPVPRLLGVNPKYSEGALAALSGFDDDSQLIQMSIPIQPGNSGGPVVNSQGLVIGVVDATVDPAFFLKKSNGQLPQGINFAVKSEFVKSLLKDNSITPTTPNPATNITDTVRKAIMLIVAKGP